MGYDVEGLGSMLTTVVLQPVSTSIPIQVVHPSITVMETALDSVDIMLSDLGFVHFELPWTHSSNMSPP